MNDDEWIMNEDDMIWYDMIWYCSLFIFNLKIKVSDWIDIYYLCYFVYFEI